jgi:HD-GYP domain-containing protein (c-di-GMP phosphodiesterase class II)
MPEIPAFFMEAMQAMPENIAEGSTRILAIADAYDVMTDGRPYKKAITRREAVKEIEKCAGTQFDPELAALFVEIFNI